MAQKKSKAKSPRKAKAPRKPAPSKQAKPKRKRTIRLPSFIRYRENNPPPEPAKPAAEPPAVEEGRVDAAVHKAAFLKLYAQTAMVSRAAELAGIGRGLHYRWLDSDSEYAAAFKLATREAAQTLLDEAVRRAREGIDKPVFYQGFECGLIRKYSDGLMEFLLAGLMPETFKRRLEHSGEVNVNLLERIQAGRERLAKAREPQAQAE